MIPYLTVHDGAAAIDFYRRAFGAVEQMRVVMDDQDGRIGHAELRIGDAAIYLSDEFPEMDVMSPRTLGGTTVALHLEVADVDAVFAAATTAGAAPLRPPADQPYGTRQGTVRDPFGHRWMLSQATEAVTPAEFGERVRGQGMTVTGPELPVATGRPTPAPASASTAGGIWAALNFGDAHAGIRFVVDVLGFEAQLVVTDDDPAVVVHSQLRWPEGGIVQAATANRPGNVFSARPVGTESLYVITRDPRAVYERCVAAGVEVVQPLNAPDHDPDGLGFSIRDPEGNLWSFGTYDGAN